MNPLLQFLYALGERLCTAAEALITFLFAPRHIWKLQDDAHAIHNKVVDLDTDLFWTIEQMVQLHKRVCELEGTPSLWE